MRIRESEAGGAYNTERLANAAQNTWISTLTFAYATLLQKENLEQSPNYGGEFYTTNDPTQYLNASFAPAGNASR